MTVIEVTPEEESSFLEDYDTRRLQEVYAEGIERIRQMIAAGDDDPGKLAEVITSRFVIPSRAELRYTFLLEWSRLQTHMDLGEIDNTGFSIGLGWFCSNVRTPHLSPMEILSIGEAHRVDELSIRTLATIYQRNKETIQKAVRIYDKRPQTEVYMSIEQPSQPDTAS